MAEKKYLIGEVSAITGIAKETLRFYDHIQLLKPAYVDPKNRYRYYTYDQFWTLDIITCCRDLHMPIDTIRQILASRSNQTVLEVLAAQQQEALRLSQYYRRIAADIDWYRSQSRQIEAVQMRQVAVKTLPARTVLYGDNHDDIKAYHLKLQALCQKAVGPLHSIRRSYGFILEPDAMKNGVFAKKGEYISFDEAVMPPVDAAYLTRIPAGTYACISVRVVRNQTDFSPLLDWLQLHQVQPRYVIADEIGLQLFDYIEAGYVCEVKVKL